jgi:hypothetical protein
MIEFRPFSPAIADLEPQVESLALSELREARHSPLLWCSVENYAFLVFIDMMLEP